MGMDPSAAGQNGTAASNGINGNDSIKEKQRSIRHKLVSLTLKVRLSRVLGAGTTLRISRFTELFSLMLRIASDGKI